MIGLKAAKIDKVCGQRDSQSCRMVTVYDQEAVEQWVELCEQERILRETEGVSQEQKNSMKTRVIMGMVDLMPNLTNDERVGLLMYLLQQEFGTITAVEPEDPATD